MSNNENKNKENEYQNDEKKSWSDILKKVASASVGATFMTEDAIKKLLQDLPLPKELMTSLLDNAKNSKSEFIKSLSSEVATYLKQVSPKELLNHLVTNFDVEVNAKFKFKPKKNSSLKK